MCPKKYLSQLIMVKFIHLYPTLFWSGAIPTNVLEYLHYRGEPYELYTVRSMETIVGMLLKSYVF